MSVIDESQKTAAIREIQQQISTHPVFLYMKGTPDFPQCGFSAKVVQILKECGVEYGYSNVLENPHIRATLPEYMNWPTFPQLYVREQLVGGCDIVTDMFADGELKALFAEL
jgi:monothiol glutaredoxin